MRDKPVYRKSATTYTASTLIGCLAVSLGAGGIAIYMLPLLVATNQWFAAGAASAATAPVAPASVAMRSVQTCRVAAYASPDATAPASAPAR